MKLEPLKSLDQLMKLVDERRAIVAYGHRLPAAVAANWQCSAVRRMIDLELIKVYPKPDKTSKTKPWNTTRKEQTK